MDTNLNIPIPCIPIPPPPLDETLVILNESERLDQVSITNPLNYSNIPDTKEAHSAIFALNRIRQTLSDPFNSPENTFDCETWSRFVLEIVASIHEGLINVQTFATTNLVPYDAFEDLSAGEVGVITDLKKILDSIDDFFYSESETTNEQCI
jgi:hypothetical protein